MWGNFVKLVLVVLLCLPLMAQETGEVVVATWKVGCTAIPRDDCWQYAFLPPGSQVVKADHGPWWAYQIVLPPGTNPHDPVYIPGPPGPMGPQGIQGIQGIPGPPGPPGSGSGGAFWAADLLDCKPSIAGNVATIKGPCRVNIGGEVFSITTDATATLSGASTSGTVRWYWDVDGYLLADKRGASATLTCNAACRAVTTTGSGPYVGLPVADMDFAGNVFTSVRDNRAVYGLKVVECGAGATCVEKQGITTVSVP